MGCYANGALYWAIRDPSKFFGFDLTNEVFFDLPKLPDCCEETGCFYFLMVLGGNLYTQSAHVYRQAKLEFYMLVSDKNGEVASGNWRKEFVVGGEIIVRFSIRPFPLAYSKGGDSILLVVASGDELFWYNLEKRTRQKVEIAGMSTNPRSYSYHVCWESLVSLGNDSAFDGPAEE
ncbi:hypothetical protein SLA2020_112330 [Shorea laevis]